MVEFKKLSMQPTQTSLVALLDSDDGTGYHIPLYQRDFTWSETEVTDFIQDALDSHRTNRQRFFGTILLSENAPQHDKQGSSPSLYVIDGQQRLTTALLTLTAMRHLALEIATYPPATELATRLNDRITIQGAGSLREPRLFANRVNSEFMTTVLSESTTSLDKVVESFEKIKLKATQRRCQAMLNAYQSSYRLLRNFVVKTVQDVDVDDDDALRLSGFLSAATELKAATECLDAFRLHFLRNSVFVKIQVQDWMESFELFDGLNNRGMELAKKDVLKNVILSRAAKSGIDAVEQVEKQWQGFDDVTQGFEFTKFLRHWLLLEHSEVSIGGATRKFIQLLGDESPKRTVERLCDAALCYSAIVNPDVTLTPNLEERRGYIELNRLSAERVRPIMLAALLKNIPTKQRSDILRVLERLQFRRSAICQLDNKTLETSVQRIASSLFLKGATEAKKVIVAIEQLIPNDEVFEANFKTRSGVPSVVARHMLLRIENHLRATEGLPALDFEDVTLEHILPQQPEEHWGLDPKKPDVKQQIDRLGNLTLLRRVKNSEASNLSFAEKKITYGKVEHSLFISRTVITKEKWGAAQITERQQALADYAKDCWR
jgi:hypothetical protein